MSTSRHQKAAWTAAEIRQLVDHPEVSRSQADLILVAYALGWRRSEVVALRCGDLRVEDKEGIVVQQGKTKTNQAGIVREVGIPWIGGPYCPAAAIVEALGRVRVSPRWTLPATLPARPVFREVCPSGNRFWELCRRWAVLLGHDPYLYGGHSFRAAHITEARLRGCPDWAIDRQTGHRSGSKIQDRYTRPQSPFTLNSVRFLGLETQKEEE